jgi:site-specific DNA-methyltransferase (adenine-specific)
VGTEDKIDFERKENGITQSGWKDVNRNPYEQHSQGRWPANFIHDGSEEVVGLFPQAGGGFGKRGGRNGATVGDYGMGATMETVGYGDSGSAARFFYCAKASKADRDEGCEGLEAKQVFGDEGGTYQGLSNSKKPSCNHHPTVKPTDLMRYLCRLVTPPSGTVLDPFMGSGSTGKAAMLEGFAFVGIEREAEYIDIAKARIQSAVGLL